MKKISSLMIVCLLFVPFTSFAKRQNLCKRLHIQIANTTNEFCSLIPSSVSNTKGVIETPPPISIAPGSSKQFTMVQNFFGPKVRLSYKCGDKKVTISSQQNKCIFWAGAVHGGLSHFGTSDGISATHERHRGSGFWGNGSPGQSNWTIHY